MPFDGSAASALQTKEPPIPEPRVDGQTAAPVPPMLLQILEAFRDEGEGLRVLVIRRSGSARSSGGWCGEGCICFPPPTDESN
jgi:hypothetical protein